MYDIIGDIHGYASKLKELLARMDYVFKDGVWQHPNRRVIFVGDFVDRGLEQVETVMIAREMVTRGHALAVMGNHELNAVAWATPDPENPGCFMRKHSEKNRKQHSAFLDQVGEGTELHRDIIEWFKTLPLFLELDGIRVVHACWHEEFIKALAPALDDKQRVKPEHWVSLLREDTDFYKASETLLKGLEIKLPNNLKFHDKEGHVRDQIRTQWWLDHPDMTYRDLAIAPPEVIESIPHEPIPSHVMPGYDGGKLLFVGHYWYTGTPAPLTPHVACLDYSIAAQSGHASSHKGKLCAYRYDGETELQKDRFVWVDG